jgi:hypothetical protein
MTRTLPSGRAGALLIPIALFVAACGGGSASGAPSAGASTAPGAPVDSALPSTGIVLPSSIVLPSGLAIPSFDLSQLTAGLANVDSYRVTISIGGKETYTGTVVTKPVLSRDLTINGTTHVVVIGNDAWTGQSGQPLKPVPAAIASGLFAAFDPTMLVGAFSGAQWAASSANKGTETKNGVNATHYRIDSTTVAAGFSGLPSGAAIDTWISDKGFLVGLEATGFPGGDMSIQVSNVDDPANKVERPS